MGRPSNLSKKIKMQIERFRGQNFYIGNIIRTSKEEIKNGNFEKIGITIKNGEIFFNEEFIPNIIGKMRYSKMNKYGWEYPRKDLPKISFYRDIQDWNGDLHYHVYMKKDVYQKAKFPPKGFSLKIELSQEGSIIILKIIVNEILNFDNENIFEDVQFAINILKEHGINYTILKTDLEYKDYLETIKVSWELLPKDIGKQDLIEYCRKTRELNKEENDVLQERVDFLYSIKKEGYSFIQGLSGINRYIGIKFNENLALFENLEYGNATYIIKDNWENLSQLTRKELKTNYSNDIIIVNHFKNWQGRIRYELEKLSL